MTNLDAYAKRYTAQYAEGSFETLLVAIRRRHVVHWLEHYGARRVLEVGCGLEPLFRHYDAFEAWQIVEPIADFCERARELGSGDDRIRVLRGQLEEQAETLARATFDFIVVSSLLHEVSDPTSLLAAVRFLSSETTTVHVNVPNMMSFHRLLAAEMGLIADVTETSELDRAFGHHGRFDSASLATLFEVTGFTVLDSGTYFVKPFTHKQMDAILGTGAFDPALVDGLDRMTKYMPDHGCELYANARKT